MIEHDGKKPVIHETAYAAPNAVISGNVVIEEDVRILYGVVITAEGSSLVIKKGTVIMENAVLRSVGSKKQQLPLYIGENVLIGPHAYLTGCTVGDGVFVAGGAKVYNGANIGAGSIIAIGGIVHVNANLPENSRVPIYNVVIGSPAKIYSPNEVGEINSHLHNLDFLGTVSGMPSNPDLSIRLKEAVIRYARALGKHQEDEII